MTKKITICFYGTCNHPRDAKQEREWFGLGDIEDNGITNVLKLHVLFGGKLNNSAGKLKDQHSFYYSGVGTYGNKVQKIFNAGFAPENLDVRRIIRTAGADLKKIYKQGDSIFLFGFSRGAAIARRFAAVINNYIEIEDDQQPVNLLCVFDTVASIGFPNLDDDKKPQSDVIFENLTVSPYVKEALHLLSCDERRIAFMPTLMNQDKRVTEVWFSGAHADVGGGFWFDGLSDTTLKFVIDNLKSRGHGIIVSAEDDVNYKNLVALDGSYRIDRDDVQISPNIKGKSHQQDRFGPVAALTLATRDIRVSKNDKEWKNGIPLLHQSVTERIKKLVDYRPRALKGIQHQVVDNRGNPIGEPALGVWDYIQDLPKAA